MNLKQIKYFLNLAETLNFTRAAELSQVTQPALTKAIQKLENELGGQLLFRDGKDARLTELGRIIRSEFEKIIASEMRAKELADQVVHEPISNRFVQYMKPSDAFVPYWFDW